MNTQPSPGWRETTMAPLRARNTFGLDAMARRLLQVHDAAALPDALREAGREALLLGGGSNLLLVSPVVDCVVTTTDARVAVLDDDGKRVRVRCAAGANWHGFVMHALAQGWNGLENLALIPGTVGAAPIQNIGAYGVEVMDLIESVEACDRRDGRVQRLPHAACGFRYRDSTFKADPQRHAVLSVDFRLHRGTGATLDYAGIREELDARGVAEPGPRDVADAVIAIRRRKLPDPAIVGNAGSFFKNPVVPAAQADALAAAHPGMPVFRGSDGGTRKLSAAWLIDQCGWKGHRDGDAGVSAAHALVLVNHGHATGAQLLQLARRIAASVRARFGIPIEPEPRIIGAQW